MTSAQYSASRPDLAVNWQRAHDAAWIAANPGSQSVVDWVKSYPSFTAYLLQDFQTANPGQTFSDSMGTAIQPAATTTGANSWVWWAAAGAGLYLAWKKGWLKF